MAIATEALKARALELGFQSVGVCDAVPAPHHEAYQAWLGKGYHGDMGYLARHLALKRIPTELLEGAQSVVAVTLNYHREPLPPDKPKIARYALGCDYHKVMRSRLKLLGAWIEAAVPNCKTRACVDSAPILERDYANLAGLGFFGKNTMLINPKRGSWFFIGLVLTTSRFTPDAPATGGCGTCTKCIDACPTGAIIHEDGRWQLDARRCISYLTIEHRGLIERSLSTGGWAFGCDVCQEVCPFNEPRETQPLRGQHTTETAFLEDRDWPDASLAATLSEEEWDVLTRGSAVRRAGYDGWLRNARNATR